MTSKDSSTNLKDSSANLSTLRDRSVVRKTKQLQGTTDLTLLAPIKDDFIPSLDSRTYETRVRYLLKTLHSLRATSREYSPLRPFLDTAARIRTISSLRLAIIDHQVLLAVTFDKPWEPYIRDIWDDVGALLDVIFCNCEGYPLASQCSFAEYMTWVRSVQQETHFFFNASAQTVDDLQYLRQIERIHREGSGEAAQLAAARTTLHDPATLADAIAANPRNRPEVIKQGLLALSALYRLVDMYPPAADVYAKSDEHILQRAAHELLRGLPISDIPAELGTRFATQLAWFKKAKALPKPPRPVLKVESESAFANDVQGGILSSHEQVTHGCVLLFGIDDPHAAALSLKKLMPTTHAQACQPGQELSERLNIGFTYEGLCQLGLEAGDLQKFSQEFQEGMEQRAGLLGDVRCNHPRNWRLPARTWPAEPSTQHSEMSMIHVVVRLGIPSTDPACAEMHDIQKPQHPLHNRVRQLVADATGLTLLSVQTLLRRDPGHFGYKDGISQPQINATAAEDGKWHNEIPLGDALLGYANRYDFPAPDRLLTNGSYLVIRKLRQDVQFWHEHLARQSSSLGGISADELKAKIMGRTLNGEALANPANPTSNDFTYDDPGNATGRRCPFQAHVRRTNPRKPDTPRIVRRGMSFGPAYDPSNPSRDERGILFMAYNARIAEQFEAIQRWISGGNSTDVYSGDSDPVLGVPELGDERVFRFQDGDKLRHARLTDASAKPFVILDWGLYAFVPSIAGLKYIIDSARVARAQANVEAGKRIIDRLLQQYPEQSPTAAPLPAAVAAWKAVLEDIDSRYTGVAANVWAAIRAHHGGVLRTPYGVLVCSRKLVMQVFADQQNYSVGGFLPRLRDTIGEIYLGRDAGSEYENEARSTNLAIAEIPMPQAFNSAFKHTAQALKTLIADAQALARRLQLPGWELTLDLKELIDPVLAALSREWFDVPDGTYIQEGGWRWDWQPCDPPLLPGHFTSPSRYTFQPHPGAGPTLFGKLHGQALRAAMNAFVASNRNASNLKGPLSKAMFAAFPSPSDNDLLARNLTGVLMGFLPSADGNLRATLYEWIEQRTLWEVQQAYLNDPAKTPFEKARSSILPPLMNTMRLRPVPELAWRTATRDHSLGDVGVEKGDQMVIAIVSATHEDRESGNNSDNVFAIFGGDRRSAAPGLHACPAYQMAMGTLLGFLAGLLEGGSARPTPASLTLSYSGVF